MSENYIEGISAIELERFEAEGYTDEDALGLSQSLIEDAIPCLSQVYNTLSARDKKLVQFAVLEMAKFIKIDYFNFERSTSPFQSETIGSYTYNKMVRSVSQRTDTGVPGFDRAVARLADMCGQLDETGGGVFAASSEQVFAPGFHAYRVTRETGWMSPSLLRDPYVF